MCLGLTIKKSTKRNLFIIRTENPKKKSRKNTKKIFSEKSFKYIMIKIMFEKKIFIKSLKLCKS